MREYTFDILVIGGGGAGFTAANTAANTPNLSVCVVNKGWTSCTGATVMAPGAIAAFDEKWKTSGDSKELYIKDTLKGGAYINNTSQVQILADTSPSLIHILENMGAIFQRDSSGQKYLLRTDGGHSYPRSVYLEDHTGMEIIKALTSTSRKNSVTIHQNIMIIKLIVIDGKIYGALGIDMLSLETVKYTCSSVILATGGGGSLYKNTDNPVDLTGDGYALALDAGATLCDMEFVQFYPIGFVNNTSKNGVLAGLLYYSKLYNAKGERFMEKYDPENLEMTTRDFLSQCIIKEISNGNGGPNGGVFLDLTFHPEGFLEKMIPGLCKTYHNLGIDPYKDRIEVAPTVHFFMGGLLVDCNWHSNIKGLFGAGEVCGGMHGGNRLSQNALAEALVSGYISGQNAAIHATNSPNQAYDIDACASLEKQVNHYLNSDSGIAPLNIKKEIQDIMWKHVGVIRSHESLTTALSLLEKLEDMPIYVSHKDKYMNHQIIEAFEIHNMILTAKAVIYSALERKESRAAHFRSDFPTANNSLYLSNIHVNYKDKNFYIKNEKKCKED